MPKPWKVVVDGNEIAIDLRFPTGEQRLILRYEDLGLRIIWPQIDALPIAFLDFWNQADPFLCAWDRPQLVLQVLSPKQTDDPLAFVEFYRGQTVVSFDTMAEMKRDPECDATAFLSNKVFGYFGMPNWNTEDYDV